MTGGGATTPLLQVRGLESGYAGMRVLDGIDLKVHRGETVAVVGGNGAGKTTLIRTITGMIKATAGSVEFDGVPLVGVSTDRICELGLIQVPEGRQIFASQSVESNLRLGAILRRARGHEGHTMQRIYEMFPRLAERRRQLAGTLSGGEQQMLAIGRALMAQPVMLMLDEPSLGLAPMVVEQMFRTVALLASEGMSILLVEQNVAESLRLCQRAYVLENGAVALSGAGGELLSDDRVRQAYLGL
ncbi:MAG: ABC transporter ATP-binding protein [Burkholderiaceae bacterium]